MSKTAFLFPGQGVQKAGMGKDFYEHSAVAREIFDMASGSAPLDGHVKKLRFTENRKPNQMNIRSGRTCDHLSAMARSAKPKE